MKKLVFVIQLIFLYSGLAMADPVISLKTLLHEMTDRSVLARWPENAYTCKQFSSYDRSSHNMTDKRAWFGNFDQGQFICQEENGGRTEYVMIIIQSNKFKKSSTVLLYYVDDFSFIIINYIPLIFYIFVNYFALSKFLFAQ